MEKFVVLNWTCLIGQFIQGDKISFFVDVEQSPGNVLHNYKSVEWWKGRKVAYIVIPA